VVRAVHLVQRTTCEHNRTIGVSVHRELGRMLVRGTYWCPPNTNTQRNASNLSPRTATDEGVGAGSDTVHKHHRRVWLSEAP